MIFTEFFRALAQIGDPKFRSVLLRGVLGAFGLLVVVYFGFVALIQMLVPAELDLPLIGTVDGLATLLSWASLPLMLLLSVVLMVPVASLFMGFFLEDIAGAVEAKHYPQLPPAPGVSLYAGLKDSINFIGLLVVLNLLALLVSFWLGPLVPLIFVAVNGYLLGREYFTLAAARRVGTERAGVIRRANSGRIWVAGMLMALPLMIPVVNLLVPVLGVATFTHLFHRMNGTPRLRG